MVQGANWFVIEHSDVWGRPVGVAVAEDGALLGMAGSVLSTHILDGASQARVYPPGALWGSLDGLPKMLAYTCSLRLTSNSSAFS